MVSLSTEEGGFGWKIFESICHNRMLGHSVKYFDYKYHNGAALVTGQDNSSLTLGGCKAIKGTTGNLITAARQDEHVLFYSFDPQYPLIDCIYRTGNIFYAFQTTVGKTHSCIVEHLVQSVKETGGPSNFLLHYLTCSKNYGEFKFKNVAPLVQLLTKEKITINVVCIPRPDDEQI